MAVNRRRMSLREGKVFINGNKVLDAVKCEIMFAPDVSESRALGERGMSRRWLGRDVTGTITEYKSTPWIKDAIKQYESTGETPEFTVQGIQDDTNSDYYESNGSDVVTCEGCVLTGDLPLLSLDSEGDLVQDEVEFGAYGIV